MQLIDLTGQNFGLWVVIRRVKTENKMTLWECKCQCGNIKHVYSCHLRNGNSKSCGCNILKGRKHKQWRGYGDISGGYWDHITRGAHGETKNWNGKKRKPIEFQITIKDAWNQFLKQDKKCALTGICLIINWARKTGPPHNTSLDRIDSSKGYLINNIQWIYKDLNMMKRNYDQDYFISMCKKVAEYN